MTDQNINYKITVDVESGTASLRDLKGKIIANKIPLSELRQEFGNFAKTVNATDFNKFKQGLDSATKSQQNLKNASGSATSAALELGRVIQDAPYGIRGMANNITQLASQLAFATKDAGSFKGAIKEMIGALKGPLGVVLAISAVVSILDYLYGANKKATSSVNEFNKSIADSYTKINRMEVLKGVMDDNTQSVDNQKQAFKELKEMGYDPAKKSLDEFIESQKKLVVVTAGIKAVEDELKKIMMERLDLQARFREEMKVLLDEDAYGKDISKAVLEQIKLDKQELDKKESDLKADLDGLIRRSLDLTDFKDKETKGSKTSDLLNLSVFNPKAFDVESITLLGKINDLNQQIELLSAETEEDKLNIKLNWLKIGLKEEEVARINALKKDYQDYENNLTKKYDKEEEKNKELLAKGKTTQNEFDAWQQNAVAKVLELSNVAEQNKDVGVQAIMDEYEKLIKKYEELYGIRLKALGMSDDEDEKAKEFDALSSYIDSYKTLMSGLTDFIDGEFERQLTIEQNKTNSLNEELNNRLLNENLSKDERARIQNEIAQNDEALRKKKEIIEKKQFQITKMANIAGALTQTYSGAMAAYWNTLQNPLNKLLPDAGLLRAKINAGIATGAGLLQVAAIARQKFQSSASSAPVRGGGGGGAGGGAGDRSFNFNLVGNNRENQLANAIQGQFNQPLKAYVVSRDMSNQQQLDANIVNSARF
jgi:hypothetical protein